MRAFNEYGLFCCIITNQLSDIHMDVIVPFELLLSLPEPQVTEQDEMTVDHRPSIIFSTDSASGM